MKMTPLITPKPLRGMTILELTVVILVLLSLVSILMVAAAAWKKGSDRAANLLNIRNCQQAMRGHDNMRIDRTVTTFTATDLAAYMKFPSSISTITYTAGTTVTAKGVLWLTATYGASTPSADYAPPATLYTEW
jgi:type II secretory pathway pseudopilin PulG